MPPGKSWTPPPADTTLDGYMTVAEACRRLNTTNKVIKNHFKVMTYKLGKIRLWVKIEDVEAIAKMETPPWKRIADKGHAYVGAPCDKGHSGLRFKKSGVCVFCFNEKRARKIMNDNLFEPVYFRDEVRRVRKVWVDDDI